MMQDNERLITLVKEIYDKKFQNAKVIFLAGSLIRGEGTKYSDLDLVVVFEKLKHAYRESFFYKKYPVEAFVHDPETLKFFFKEIDAKSGKPFLPYMVLEGLEIPQSSNFSRKLKRLAAFTIKAGPPKWTNKDVNSARYHITDLVDDIRNPRSAAELTASGAELYRVLADFFFRAQCKWSCNNKYIPRLLKKIDPDIYKQFLQAFDYLFIKKSPAKVIKLTEKILTPYGGFYFAGHKLNAPLSWRKQAKNEKS